MPVDQLLRDAGDLKRERSRVKLVVLGLSLSSSWGNGHATTYRALLEAPSPSVATTSCSWSATSPGMRPIATWRSRTSAGWPSTTTRRPRALAGAIEAADAVIVGSYVPEGVAVIGGGRLGNTRRRKGFYDIDTPVTLAKLDRGDEELSGAPSRSRTTTLYLSFTGGPCCAARANTARAAIALYCSVDAEPATGRIGRSLALGSRLSRHL
jgi:hypothetical protein